MLLVKSIGKIGVNSIFGTIFICDENRYMIMKTIKIHTEVKKRLDKARDGKSVNKFMRILLEDAEEYNVDISKPVDVININMDDELLDKLKRCKKSSSESHSETISRLLDSYDK